MPLLGRQNSNENIRRNRRIPLRLLWFQVSELPINRSLSRSPVPTDQRTYADFRTSSPSGQHATLARERLQSEGLIFAPQQGLIGYKSVMAALSVSGPPAK